MKAIVDTGPWVALIDRSESMHLNSVHWLKQFSGTLYSTEAVLTEVLYLLNFSIKAQCAAIDFVVESLIEIVPSNRESLRKTKNLMRKYADLPMDYADATLVCLAMDTGIQNIVTFDKKDFTIYRSHGKKKFKIIKIKGGKCSKCGYNKNMGALELHHPNRNNDWNSQAYLNWSWKKIENEILPDTVLVCVNCHREIHYPELTNYSLL